MTPILIEPPSTLQEISSPGSVVSFRSRLEHSLSAALAEAMKTFLDQTLDEITSGDTRPSLPHLEESWESVLTASLDAHLAPGEVRQSAVGEVWAESSQLPSAVYVTASEIIRLSQMYGWSEGVLHLVLEEALTSEGLLDLEPDTVAESLTAASVIDNSDEKELGLLGMLGLATVAALFLAARARKRLEDRGIRPTPDPVTPPTRSGHDPLEDAEDPQLGERRKRGLAAALAVVTGAGLWRRSVRRIRRDAATRAVNRMISDRMSAIEATRGLTVIGKRWVSLRDNRVRPTHSMADGQVVGRHENFIVGGYPMRFPQDPLAPIEETANCRCLIVAVVGRA